MPSPTPKVSIIIVNWNGWQDTIECLRSLEEVEYKNFSVTVVDNGSADESLKKFGELRITDYGLRIIQNDENLGFSGGNNVGIKKALEDGADYILLLNNDTLVEPDFLEKLVEVAESDPHIGIVGPKIYFANTAGGNRIWFGGGKLNWLKTRGSHTDYEKIDASNKPSAISYQLYDVDYITGCCLLIKRAVIERIGLLSEDFFLYYEDVDWCLKAGKKEFRIVYAPAAFIWHKVSRSAKPGSASYVYYHVRNGLMLSWRHGNTLTRLILPLFILWTLVKQVAKFTIPSKRMWAGACFHGIIDFYRGRTGNL
ncbi:MAG: glycosyltransferase family 2 protein [bacterium]|nr:glycosyltransferase family 2 protein [bacterium]